MRRSRVILFFVVAALTTTTLLTFKPRWRPEPARQPKETLNERLARLPITDFEVPEPIDHEQRRRRRIRSARHNSSASPEGVKRPVLKEDIEPALLDLPLSNQRPEPAIPATESDVIIIGTITDIKAHISDDRTSVYSEMSVRVDEVLKENAGVSLSVGSTLDAERSGGAVRFPSGKILRRASLGRNIPQSGRSYLFFLTYNEEAEDFSIITGFEVAGDRVVPLDGTASLEKGGRFQQFSGYEAYTGTSLSTFLAEVRAAIVHIKPL
jgi:hypothetical protein